MNELPLWKLTIYLANIEKRLIDLKKQGVTSQTRKSEGRLFDNLRQERNDCRRRLLKKLIEWDKNPEEFMNRSEEGITYSEAISFIE